MGQFVDRRLSLREWQALVDGLASFAAYPEGYRGPAFNYMYLEPVEGALWGCRRERQKGGGSEAAQADGRGGGHALAAPALTRAAPLAGLAGAVAAVPANGTAYPHRSVGFDVVTDTFFIAEPGARDAAQAWMEDLYGRRCVPTGSAGWGARHYCLL